MKWNVEINQFKADLKAWKSIVNKRLITVSWNSFLYLYEFYNNNINIHVKKVTNVFVILLVIVTFSNQLWRGHHFFYDMPIRWSIIIILLQKVIVFENIFIWYNIGAINYCYNTQITVFSKLKTKQNKTWKKENYFFRRTTFSRGRQMLQYS